LRLIVLDTNVLISAGIKEGSTPFRLIHSYILDSHVKVVTSPSVVFEYREVCSRIIFIKHGFPPPWLEVLLSEGLNLPEPNPWPLPLPDVDDGIFLALAKASGAWLVTGNIRHYPEDSRDGVTVCTPSEYVALLDASGLG